jgi:hypothetical protein
MISSDDLEQLRRFGRQGEELARPGPDRPQDQRAVAGPARRQDDGAGIGLGQRADQLGGECGAVVQGHDGQIRTNRPDARDEILISIEDLDDPDCANPGQEPPQRVPRLLVGIDQNDADHIPHGSTHPILRWGLGKGDASAIRSDPIRSGPIRSDPDRLRADQGSTESSVRPSGASACPNRPGRPGVSSCGIASGRRASSSTAVTSVRIRRTWSIPR